MACRHAGPDLVRFGLGCRIYGDGDIDESLLTDDRDVPLKNASLNKEIDGRCFEDAMLNVRETKF